MAIGADLFIFDKYRNASGHAFTNNIVSEEDKDRYDRVHQTLLDVAQGAVDGAGEDCRFDIRHARFYRDGGIQGQRPKDLWVSVINEESNAFGKYPQVYMIASDTGIELGFTVAIHESDYYDEDIKARNRSIVPLLYSKLPGQGSELLNHLHQGLRAQDGWLYATKARNNGQPVYGSINELFAHLKSGAASSKGGGAIIKRISASELDQPGFDLQAAFSDALTLFRPLMDLLRPSSGDIARLGLQDTLIETTKEVEPFDPTDMDDGKKKIMRAIAQRQGQSKFRQKLMEAYGGQCAISGTQVPSALQAAHIVPYNGEKTNHVTNGILLRADIHNLFDLGLISIDPATLMVCVADELVGSTYEKFHKLRISLPDRPANQPSQEALKARERLFTNTDELE